MTTRSVGTLAQPDRPSTALAVNLANEDSVSLEGILSRSNWLLRKVQTCQEALDVSRNARVPVVLCQPHMSDGGWDTLIDKLRELAAPPAVVVVSRLADEHLWTEVLSVGGYDVLATPFDRSELFRVLFLAWMASKPEADRMPARLKKPPAVETVADHGVKRLCASMAH